MSLKLLLRLLLGALICLNGTTALWASTRMAIDHASAHGQPEEDASHRPGHGATAQAPPACTGGGCPTLPSAPDTGAPHAHAPGDTCSCGSATLAGCSCSCVFPVGFITVSVPFIARHALRTSPPAYAEIHAPFRWTGSIFRPPIG